VTSDGSLDNVRIALMRVDLAPALCAPDGRAQPRCHRLTPAGTASRWKRVCRTD